jgi:predicted TIM-barrel fold metal-dependent hydrolase
MILASALALFALAAAPRADHHQHLLSPAGAELEKPAVLTPVEVPAEIAELLRKVEQHWNDVAGLQELMTDDSFLLSAQDARIAKGRAAVAQFLGTRFARGYRFTPVAVSASAASAQLAGYFSRGEGAATAHIGYFTLGLSKATDGVWRIASETVAYPGPSPQPVEDAAALVELLDAAGIERAVVLSDAYWFDSPKHDVRDAYAAVRAENDWTAQQVARFPKRLVAFCSFNPLANYAITELERCQSGGFLGLKLHFGMSEVDLKNPVHVEKVRAVMAAANRLHMPVIIHVRADRTYGREQAEVLLSRIVTAAPDVVVQIAHLWGGEGFSDEALAVYADAVSSGDPRTKNLYFDVAEAALVARGQTETLRTIARRIHQIGVTRVLFGSDGPVPEALAPREAWRDFRTNVPLTEAEIAAIAGNVAPYLPKQY